MSDGFIFDWTRTDLAGRIHVTSDPTHKGENAAFRLSDCSFKLETFLQNNDTPPSVSVTFDLFKESGTLRARNVDAV